MCLWLFERIISDGSTTTFPPTTAQLSHEHLQSFTRSPELHRSPVDFCFVRFLLFSILLSIFTFLSDDLYLYLMDQGIFPALNDNFNHR